MPAHSDSSTPPPRAWRWWLITILGGLLVFSVRAHWIAESSYRLPYWDEIPAELVTGAHRPPGAWPTLAEGILPHNEHRILWQRLIAHALVAGNGGIWDSQLRCLANAAITALYAAALAAIFRGCHTGRRGHALFWPAILLLSSPLAYQNMLFAFQTSFHLQMLFSITALAALAGASFRQARWWFGLAAGLAAIFTNGSGFFTAPVLLVWAGIMLWRPSTADSGFRRPDRERWLSVVPTAVAAILILVVGLALLHRPEGTSQMGAANAGEFFLGFAKHLAWPWQETPWIGPVLWSPAAVLAWMVLRGRGDTRWLASARPVVCLAGWLLLNMLAMAYARGANAVGPVPRYEDFHLLGAITNAAALVLCVVEIRRAAARGARVLAPAWSGIWLVPVASGLVHLFQLAMSVELPDFRAFGALQEKNTARHTVLGDPTVYQGYISRFHIPYPDAGELKSWFDDPRVRAALPAPYRASREPLAEAATTGACANPALPPGITLPPGETWFSSSFQSEGDQEGTFTSGPITAGQSAMRLWYLGMDTGGSLKLRLKPEGGGKAIPFISERRHGTSRWLPITIPVEAGKSYRLEFSDRSKGGWGAFTLPVDEPPLSRLAATICQHAAAASAAIIGVLFLLILSTPLPPRPATEPRPS